MRISSTKVQDYSCYRKHLVNHSLKRAIDLVYSQLALEHKLLALAVCSPSLYVGLKAPTGNTP